MQPQAQPYQAPPPSDMTPEKKGPPWPKIIGIGCLVFAILGGLCGVGCWMFCQSVTGGKDDAHAFLGHIRAGDYAGAHARMAPTYQATHDVGAFQQAVMSFPALASHTDATFNSFQVNNGVHSLSGTLTTPTGPAAITVIMSGSAGTFRIIGLNVNGRPFPDL
jgi:hypothetical protein